MQRKLLTTLALALVLAITFASVTHAFVMLAIGLGFAVGFIVSAVIYTHYTHEYAKLASLQLRSDLNSYWQNVYQLAYDTYFTRVEDARQFSNVFVYSYNYYIRWAESIASAHCKDDTFNVEWFKHVTRDVAKNYLVYVKMYAYARLGFYNVAAANNRQMLDLALNKTRNVQVPLFQISIGGKQFIPYGNISVVMNETTLENSVKYLENRALVYLHMSNVTNITIPYIIYTYGYVELQPGVWFSQQTYFYNVRYEWVNLTNRDVKIKHEKIVINAHIPNFAYEIRDFDGSYSSGGNLTYIYIHIISNAYNYWKTLHEKYKNGTLSENMCPVIPPPSISTPFDPKEAWKYDPIAMKALWIAYLKALSSHNWTKDPVLDEGDVKGLTDKLVWIKADLDTNHDGTLDYKGCYFIPIGINSNVTFAVGQTTVLRDGGWGYYYCSSTNTLKIVNLPPNTTVTNIQSIQDRRPVLVDINGDGKYDTIEYNTTQDVTNITLNPSNARDFIKTVPTLPDVAWTFIPNTWKDEFNPPHILTSLLDRLFGWLHLPQIDKVKLILLLGGLFLLFILFSKVTP